MKLGIAAEATVETADSIRLFQRRNTVIAMYALSACWGIAQIVAPENALLYMASAFAFATAATSWFTIDRRILDRSRLPILQLLFFFTWPIASLIHLLSTRGIRGAGQWMMHVIGLFATMCLTFFPAMFLLYWLGILELDAVAEQ